MGIFHSSIYLIGDGEDEGCYDDLLASGLISHLEFPPRFRSIELSASSPHVAMRGRCGAGNHETYASEIAAMEALPGFVESFEWSEDHTYMYFVFDLSAKDCKTEPPVAVSRWWTFIDKWNKQITFMRHKPTDKMPGQAEPPPPRMLEDTGDVDFIQTYLSMSTALPPASASLVTSFLEDNSKLERCTCRR